MLPFIISVIKIEKFNYQLPSGTMHMWIAKRKATFNIGHCKTFAIVYKMNTIITKGAFDPLNNKDWTNKRVSVHQGSQHPTFYHGCIQHIRVR